MDDDDEFYDMISVNSHLMKRTNGGSSRNSINLSRNTIYHSTVDFVDFMDFIEGEDIALTDQMDPGRIRNNISGPRTTISGQWKELNWDRAEIDFILAYEDSEDPLIRERRREFECNLLESGLLLKHERIQKIHFTAIRAPHEVILQYASILKLRLPMKKTLNDQLEDQPDNKNKSSSFFKSITNCFHVSLDKQKFPQEYRLTCEYSNDRQYLFDASEICADSSVRIAVVSYILERTKFDREPEDAGIKKLIADNVYKAAYPLHDGDLTDQDSTRKLLFDEWASLRRWIRHQPLDKIKEYFGVKIALYFAWLGFYTNMLIIATFIGLFSLLYGYLTLSSDPISEDICNGNHTMCPLCDKYCGYWQLSETCTYSKITYTIDNPAIIVFSVLMSVWAALYLELWKRYSASITHRWGLTGFDVQAEPARPEYLAKLSNVAEEYRQTNFVTGVKEPVLPFLTKRLPKLVFSFTVVFIWVLIAIIVVFSVVLYRMSVSISDDLNKVDANYRIFIVPLTSGLINLIGINILNVIYDRIAVWLTDMEVQRTQTEYEDSLTVKTYMFKFVNFYSSIFYIAFFKGKFVGYPAKYNHIFGQRQEECNAGGCLIELTVQLAIIMVGNQALNAILEMCLPLLGKWITAFKIKAGLERAESEEVIAHNAWTKDYKLIDTSNNSLFGEYLEMVVQYGFVTLFVTAFPLAPLFALLNNIFEMRLDARKFLTYYRRPVPQRVRNIGVWMAIMNIVCRLAVASNAFILAFNSHFIPKLVYMYKYSSDGTDDGFLDFSLAWFKTEDFPAGTAPVEGDDVGVCRYMEYRNPPCDIGLEGVACDSGHEKYKRPLHYWHILAARLAFIVVYQNLVGFLISFVEWAIPDVPRKISDQIKREAFQTNEAMIRHDMEQAKLKKAQKFAASMMQKTNNSRSTTVELPAESINDSVVDEPRNNGGLTHRQKSQESQREDQTAL